MINISSSTRVDLAGGTLDCWPLYNLVEGAVTVNLSIDIKTYVELEERSNSSIKVTIDDLGFEREFVDLVSCLECNDQEMDLLRYHIRYWQPTKGFHVRTRSQSPVGGGLGGSSSLCISLLKAFKEWMGRELSVSEMVLVGSNLEAQVLRTPTGVQDYFPAAQPGLNVIELGVHGPVAEVIPFPVDEFNKSFLLVYTGKPHHSGINNWQVLKAAIEGDQGTLEALQEIADIAREMVKVCRTQEWSQFAPLFKREFSARIRLSEAFSSPEIEKLESLVLQEGAEAVKICGAGGGGSVMVWTPPEKKEKVAQVCQENGFQVLAAQAVVQN